MEHVILGSIYVVIMGRLTFDCFYWLPKKMKELEDASGAPIMTREAPTIRRRFEAAKRFKWLILVLFVAGAAVLMDSIVDLVETG